MSFKKLILRVRRKSAVQTNIKRKYGHLITGDEETTILIPVVILALPYVQIYSSTGLSCFRVLRE
jgi:hypothetical protein